ncbi:hypothetical protein METBIDRAFT_205697 [Metschnikowia bicuspidata var. bicuspidata NRRL YB-4993]|uniref:Uncharacterized protein n=1 Tax=Metschnikowia bicuspidata var. bicuspidata NRRL YB-4993 TaxID=869754 RepID=A0A1A0H9U6_9ASCO|nr:hypothetical protein METBIDRAFT_205697 [Metschnikowia bicuspidata var. bicuspidata NRRL YB-4993]OBA20770.1 hypothetical protein METBIDRAFT_205697 [Metschnikowia bicuspidata var. bicuspidata NRRL YB-4993]
MKAWCWACSWGLRGVCFLCDWRIHFRSPTPAGQPGCYQTKASLNTLLFHSDGVGMYLELQCNWDHAWFKPSFGKVQRKMPRIRKLSWRPRFSRKNKRGCRKGKNGGTRARPYPEDVARLAWPIHLGPRPAHSALIATWLPEMRASATWYFSIWHIATMARGPGCVSGYIPRYGSGISSLLEKQKIHWPPQDIRVHWKRTIFGADEKAVVF